jgi:hypothetical protein
LISNTQKYSFDQLKWRRRKIFLGPQPKQTGASVSMREILHVIAIRVAKSLSDFLVKG